MAEKVGVEQVEQISGNNQLSEISMFTTEDKGFQSNKYFLTCHTEKFVEHFEQIKGVLVPLCNKYVFGEEYGKEGKTPHIQGAFILHSKIRAATLQKSVFDPLGSIAHLPKLKNWAMAFKYCCKEGNNIISSEKIPKPLRIVKNLIGYQKEVLELIKVEPNDRDIIWVYGGYQIGKTQLCKYLVYHKYAYGPLGGEKKHILSVVKQNTEEECFIIYLTADQSMKQTNSLFDCIEEIKDGFFMSHFGTDHTGPVIMNSPHILVMGNQPPDFTKTNMDQKRFKIYCVNNKKNEICERCSITNIKLGRKCKNCSEIEKSVTWKV